MICAFENCKEESRTKGMCVRHYNRVSAIERRGGYMKIGDFCKKGHKVEDENAQFYMNHGAERVRCKTCNTTPSNRIKIGDSCGKGHVIAGENLMRVKKQGQEFFRCRQCSNESNRARRQRLKDSGELESIREYDAMRRRAWREKNKPTEYAKELERADKLLATEVKKGSATYNSLNYLRLSKRAGQASQALEDAFDRARAKCYGNPRRYMDYEEGREPSAIDAYKMCEGCPLMVECGRFAAAYHPPIGVWAGEVWVDGKVKK